MSNHFNTPTTVANPNKPYGVSKILFKNQQSLISFLENFDVSNPPLVRTKQWNWHTHAHTLFCGFWTTFGQLYTVEKTHVCHDWALKIKDFGNGSANQKTAKYAVVFGPQWEPPFSFLCVCALWWCCSIHMNQSLLITPCIFYSSTQMIMYISVINAL